MNALVPIEQAAGQVPALLQQRRAQGLTQNKNFQDGVRDAFPVLSIKGKVWQVRISGQTSPFLDQASRTPVAFIDVVLINASKELAKSYYVSGYADGDMNPPDCWSLDSIRPDPSVAQKVSPSCISCPMNAFGSKMTPDGKAAKACQDARRMVIAMPSMLQNPEPLLMLMRLPQASLKNLKAYAELLDRHGYEPGACVTRMVFDHQAAFPKVLFNFAAPLNDAQYARSVELADGPTVASMLKTPDFDNTVSTQPKQADNVAGLAPADAPIIPGITDTPQQQATVVTPQPTVVTPQATVQTPVQAVPPAVMAGNLIDLPDGRKFNPATGQFIEATAPQNMPQIDPETIALPDGTFFNKRMNAFVTGQEVGAPARTAANTPPKVTRQRKPKEPSPTPQAASGQAQPSPVQQEPVQGAPAATGSTAPADQTAALAAITGAAQGQQLDIEKDTQLAHPNGAADGGGPVVSAASMKLEDVLNALTPKG